jgi:tRNA-dihydrouridine synthase
MDNELAELYGKLRNGFFLSSMMGVTDGPFCAQRSKGCAMVQLGAYLAEPTATAADMGTDASSYLPADPGACASFLVAEVRSAKGLFDVVTCMNLATLRLEWGLEAAECFAQSGGDIVELNVHGEYGRYPKQGKLRAMVLPQHQGELFRWVKAFVQLGVPLIVKFHGQSEWGHLLPVLDEMARLSPFGVHVNVREGQTKRPNLDLVRLVKEHYPGFLLVSGYVRSADDARVLFDAGSDMVGIAAPTRGDAGYIHRIAEAFGS